MKKRFSKKELSLLISILLLATVSIGGTLAYIATQTGAITNTFTPAEVTCAVEESFNGTEKTNVKVANTGDTDAYIRAAIVVTWQDADGNVAAESVPETAYDMKLNLSTDGWFESGNYYYYRSPVAAGSSTEQQLITSCKLVNGATPPEGYYLCVEIIADAVQAKPAQAVIDAWNVTVAEDGTISK